MRMGLILHSGTIPAKMTLGPSRRMIQDLVLIVLFAALALGGPERGPLTYSLLSLLAALQIAERRVPFLLSRRGSVLANLSKLALGYLLMGFTGGVNSSYHLILLIPVISAATTLGAGGTVLFTVLACASYLSFLLFLDWTRYTLPPDEVAELSLRLAFLAFTGYLTQSLAEAHRVQARKAQAAADQLAEANRNLQEAEAAVRRSERLAALGQLSGGLAHELRNPLGTIRASAEMLVKNLPQDNSLASELVGFISAETDRINSLVTRFLEFARPLELRPVEAELAEVIDRAVAQLERHTPSFQITVYKNYSPDVRPFPFDTELLERLVFNLLLNAAQATPPGGAITVKTRPVDGNVELTVIDRGSGIASEYRESIFNPFFTTKSDGVGLGLAIVSKIVDLHHGTMAVESEPGKGSVFRVYLPTERKA
jgi:two-component system sensor histidine kinase HydH